MTPDPARRQSRVTARAEAKSPHPDLDRVLISERAIRRRVTELAREVSAAYGRKSITVVSIVSGAVVFTADLLRQIDNPLRLDCIRVSSYRSLTRSRGSPRVLQSLTLPLAGRHVLLIDDILDTGRTLRLVTGLIRKRRPASLRVCVFLDKPERREVPLAADFVGFRIPNLFVVGYGMDFAERYRNLPCIGVLRDAAMRRKRNG